MVVSAGNMVQDNHEITVEIIKPTLMIIAPQWPTINSRSFPNAGWLAEASCARVKVP